MDKEKVVFDIVKSNEYFFKKLILFAKTIEYLYIQDKGNLEAINVVGKNGYYIIDIIAYKREIQPYDLEIINGLYLIATIILIWLTKHILNILRYASDWKSEMV